MSSINSYYSKIFRNKAFYEEEKLVTEPKNALYRSYFKDQRVNYPKKFILISIVSYLGGCFFGLVMLAFSMLGASRLEQSVLSISTESFYKDTAEFRKAMKQRVLMPMHRNGHMMIRITLTIGIFNALMIYMPFVSNRFGEFYGLANARTVGYFLVPYLVITKMKKSPLNKKIIFITSSGLVCYCYEKCKAHKLL